MLPFGTGLLLPLLTNIFSVSLSSTSSPSPVCARAAVQCYEELRTVIPVQAGPSPQPAAARVRETEAAAMLPGLAHSSHLPSLTQCPPFFWVRLP